MPRQRSSPRSDRLLRSAGRSNVRIDRSVDAIETRQRSHWPSPLRVRLLVLRRAVANRGGSDETTDEECGRRCLGTRDSGVCRVGRFFRICRGRIRQGRQQSGSVAEAASAVKLAVGRSSLGRILVTGQGRSVYLFEKDHRKASTCYGACASAWPPVTTSRAPIATKGVAAALLGTRKRLNGTLQVTYNGHPLYEYAGDAKAGQTNGEGSNAYGGAWYVLSPAGKKIDNDWPEHGRRRRSAIRRRREPTAHAVLLTACDADLAREQTTRKPGTTPVHEVRAGLRLPADRIVGRRDVHPRHRPACPRHASA